MTSGTTATNWTEFNENPAHTGIAEGTPAAGPLKVAWTAHLDGAVYGQPLEIGPWVIAATSNDSVYALSAKTGAVVWETHVGEPAPKKDLHGCGGYFNPLGITDTPIYTASTGLIYTVAELRGYHHVLFGLSLTNGHIKLERSIDMATASNQRAYNLQRPALTIASGRVYATFGGLSDCGAYQGSIVGAPLSGNGKLIHWVTPTSRGGAIWGSGGPVVGPGGNLWLATGNGAATRGAYDGSDSVNELTPNLVRLGYFAPSTWPLDNAEDADLGSTQPALAAGNTTFIMGKRGVGYLLKTTDLGGIGGEVAQAKICLAYGAAAVDGSIVYEPCRPGGTAAVLVNAATKTIRVLWRGPAGTDGSPVIGGGAVFVTHYANQGGGLLYELNQHTGKVMSKIAIGGGLPHFSSPSLSGSMAFLGTLQGVTAVSGA
jgi:outer membrane protein assembly factor BamB